MRFIISLIPNVFLINLICFICLCNVFAGLSEAERDELGRLQLLVEKNVEISEEQMQRWEELLFKDPDNLKKIRQKEIDKWIDSLRAQGKEIDQSSIDREAESEWQDFLKQKDIKLMTLNENNMAVFLAQIRDACQVIKQKEGSYPVDLNILMLRNQSIIKPSLYEKLKRVYSIQYEKTDENYRVFGFPLEQGKTGNKIFLLENKTIFFTLDGSTPSFQSNRIL